MSVFRTEAYLMPLWAAPSTMLYEPVPSGAKVDPHLGVHPSIVPLSSRPSSKPGFATARRSAASGSSVELAPASVSVGRPVGDAVAGPGGDAAGTLGDGDVEEPDGMNVRSALAVGADPTPTARTPWKTPTVTSTAIAARNGSQLRDRRASIAMKTTPTATVISAPRFEVPATKAVHSSGRAITTRHRNVRAGQAALAPRTRNATAPTVCTAMSPALKKTSGMNEPGLLGSIPALAAANRFHEIGSHSAKIGTTHPYARNALRRSPRSART